MSRLSKFATKESAQNASHYANAETNFMNGVSFKVNPLQTLKMVAASSIFAEPQFYRPGLETTTVNKFTSDFIFKDLISANEDASKVFERVIDNALDYDFLATLEIAKELRNEYMMRLNPAVIYVRAAKHKDRASFNEKHPGYMRNLIKEIVKRPDDVTNQFEYFMYTNGSKNRLPSILKRSWADSLESMSKYQLNKYKGKKLIDLVRLSHANSPLLDELMQTGKIKVDDSETTWETLRSSNKSWVEILQTIKMPHMALLRNLRGIFSESKDMTFDTAHAILDQLKKGVVNGKQFPFRYYNAYKMILKSEVVFQRQILDALDECIDLSILNMPKLKGTVACLSDNSGSAWKTFNSEYGSVTVADIANLSSLITASQADNGFVGVFGDELEMIPVSKRNGILSQHEHISNVGKNQGQSTENGIWLFWKNALESKIHYDTVFIYSDMQAGRGQLYGWNSSDYSEFRVNGTSHIDVLALVNKYRKTVNPKVNVFTVQVGGYNNSVLPENLYRGAILSGWTGREAQYADAIIKVWNEID